MRKSDKLLDNLIQAKIIDELADKKKAGIIIKDFLSEIYNEAVLETIMASNKKVFNHPTYNDL